MSSPVRKGAGWFCDLTGKKTCAFPVVPTDDLRFRRAADEEVRVYARTEDDTWLRIGSVFAAWPHLTAAQEAESILTCLRPHPYVLYLRLSFPVVPTLRQTVLT